MLTAHESLVAYRRRYRSDTRIDAVLDLLLGDDTNPRALAFQLDRMAEHLAALPGAGRPQPARAAPRRDRAGGRASPVAGDEDSAAPIARGRRGRRPSRAWSSTPAGPLLDLAGAFVARWFADPAVARRMGRPRDPVLDQPPHPYRYGASMTGGHSVLHLVPRATATPDA